MSDEWAHRENCPDGACIGLIGPDGTCKVCGRAAPNWGDERRRGMVDAEAATEEEEDDDEHEHEHEPEHEPEHEHDEDGDDGDESENEKGDEWVERKLCSDGACVGVIGDDGTCKVCGRAAA